MFFNILIVFSFFQKKMVPARFPGDGWIRMAGFFSLPELNCGVGQGLHACLSVPPSSRLKTLFDLQLDTLVPGTGGNCWISHFEG